MSNFWENAFKEKQMMWGEKPTQIAIETSELFKNLGFKNVLVPGFGYGRNAKAFSDNGIAVSGIEISATALAIAKNSFGSEVKIFHGAVNDMPFDNEKYDGIFCHALIHLLDMADRKKLIDDCYNQLNNHGIMIFTAITKSASTFGIGEQLEKDQFKTNHGVELFFYDDDSIFEEFRDYGLAKAEKVNEPINQNPSLETEFWKIVCCKETIR